MEQITKTIAFSEDPVNTLENLIAKNREKSISIYLVVVVAIIVFIGLLPIIKVDISSQSRGIIKSSTENVPLACIVSGEITYINLKNNLSVKQGDTLVRISKAALDIEKNTQDTLANNAESMLKDLNNLVHRNYSRLTTASLREDYAKYASQCTELQSKISQAETIFSRNKVLFNKGVISRADYEKYQFDLQLAQQALTSFNKNQKASWENQKKELTDKLKNLNGSINKINVEGNNYVLLAPTAGTIENFSGLQVGSFLNSSQAIATLSPNENLIVENTVSPNDIGLIKINQDVKFQLDAFNYNQWGLLEGKVIEIDKNITFSNNEAFFKVKCKVKSKKLILKSGYTTMVSKGMTLTTRYIVTRRSLYDLLFDKMDNWLNPKIISPSTPE